MDYWPLAAVLTLITIFVTVVFLRAGMYPLRWMAIGLSIMALLSVYPILYTFWISLTNYGDGHLLTEQQSIEYSGAPDLFAGRRRGLQLDCFSDT